MVYSNGILFSAGDTENPKRISRTPVNELEHWPDNLDYRPDIAGEVTKIFELRGQTFATTASQIFAFDTQSGWTVRVSSAGCRAGGSLTPGQIMSKAGIPIDVVIFYYEKRFYAFDTDGVQLLSENINKTVESFSEEHIDNLACFYSNWEYHVSYTSTINEELGEDTAGTYNNRTLILDTERLTWWPQKYGFNDASVWNGKGDNGEVMIGNASGDGFVYWMRQGYSHAGSAIAVTYETKDFDFGMKDFDKIIRKLEAEYEFVSGTLRLRYSVDGSSLATWKSLPTYTSGDVYDTGKYDTATYASILTKNSDPGFPKSLIVRRCFIEFYKSSLEKLHIKRLAFQVIPKSKVFR